MVKYLLIIVFLLGSVKPCTALQVTFRQNAQVDKVNVTLGDIADFDEQSEMSLALASQRVAQSPPPGESITLGSLAIKQYLLNSLSISGEIAWSGPPVINLTRNGFHIGSAKIQTIIDNFLLRNRANLPDAEIRFIPSALPLPFILPIGKMTYEVIPSNPRILGSSRFSIIFKVDNRVAKNMSVRGRVEALAPIVVASRKLKKGTILTGRHITTVVKDINKIANAEFDETDFIGKKLKRSLRAGSPILASMVVARPVIKRGERVKIVFNSGAMFVSATGIARTDGRQDQMIRVQNISSKKIIYCRVTAPGLVEVIL